MSLHQEDLKAQSVVQSLTGSQAPRHLTASRCKLEVLIGTYRGAHNSTNQP